MKTNRFLVTGGSGFIGTNLIDEMINQGYQVLNVDVQLPKVNSRLPYWKKCDLLNKNEVDQVVREYNPTHVVHLAARTDINGKSLRDYAVNIEGTHNLVMVLRTINVRKVIFTSTQFVHQYHGTPLHENDYAPYTSYGESKVEMEKIIKNANLPFVWTIIRPTNIWGPWHPRYPFEFWKVLAEGKYFHPDVRNVIRSYGYVGNVVWQIKKILELPEEKVNGEVLYLGDKPIDILEWVNGFSKQQVGKEVRLLSPVFVKSLAIFGDLLKSIGVKFPITSSRYKSMTTSNDAPMEKSFQVLGTPPYNLDEGIKETVKWLKLYHPSLVKG